LDGELIFVVLGARGDEAGKTLACCIDKEQIAVWAIQRSVVLALAA
jgi:hypothetical protein